VVTDLPKTGNISSCNLLAESRYNKRRVPNKSKNSIHLMAITIEMPEVITSVCKAVTNSVRFAHSS
jgi:hypothetical protein